MTRRNPYASALATIAKRLITATATRVYTPLYEAFVIAAAAGAVPDARRLLDRMYARELPSTSPTAFSTSAIDGFCAAAGLGDRTGGLPPERAAAKDSLDQRVRGAEPRIRHYLLLDGHTHGPEPTAQWRDLPAIAHAMVRGELRAAIGLDDAAIRAAVDEIERSLALPARPVPRVQKRRVGCEYNQFYLVPEAATEMGPHFDDARDFDQGMSIAAQSVAILTPTETLYVDVEVSVATAMPSIDDAVRAVAFPFEVRGPLCLRSVESTDDEPISVPDARYDVLTCFFPSKKKPGSCFRVFRVAMYFLPAGVAGAPRCLRLEDA